MSNKGNLAIIIPVYNEEKRIAQNVGEITARLRPTASRISP